MHILPGSALLDAYAMDIYARPCFCVVRLRQRWGPESIETFTWRGWLSSLSVVAVIKVPSSVV